MSNLSGYGINDAEPAGEFAPIPAGEYEVVIDQADVCSTKSGNGTLLKTKVVVIEGDYAHRVIFHNFNIENPSQKAQQIGRGQLKSVCNALEIDDLEDTSQLLNRPMVVKVVVTKSDTYGDGNEIKSFKPVPYVVAKAPVAKEAPRESAAAAAVHEGSPWQ